jgi:hypothetical protein
MSRRLLTAVLALPLAGLALNIAASALELRGASEWRIPVAGFDPRDPLRGHYVRFRYDWRLAGNPALCTDAGACALCIEDGGATVRVVAAGTPCPGRIDLSASAIDLRPPTLTGERTPQFFGRLFVSEARAPELEAQLRAGPMVVLARLGNGGRLVNERLEPMTGDQP